MSYASQALSQLKFGSRLLQHKRQAVAQTARLVATVIENGNTPGKKKPLSSVSKTAKENGVPKGSRTPVAGMKTRSPRPLDDGDYVWSFYRRLKTALQALSMPQRAAHSMSAPVTSQGFAQGDDLQQTIVQLSRRCTLELQTNAQTVSGIGFLIARRRVAFVSQVDPKVGVDTFAKRVANTGR